MMLHKLLSNRFHQAFIAILLIAIGSVFFADIAQAQVSGELGTSYDELVLAGQQPGDKSREILSNLLSDFSANPFTTVGQPNTLLGNLFFIFNSGLFVVGTALLTYFLLATVAQTAHEGEVLGKRINGLWVPIRVTFGVFGMLPVFGGFSLAQAILMWFVILGIGLANLLTTKAIEQTSQFNALIPPPGLAVDGNTTQFNANMARNVFLMNVCVDTAEKYYNEVSSNDFFSGPQPRLDFRDQGDQTRIRSLGMGGDLSCGEFLLQRGSPRSNSGIEGIVAWRSAAVNYEEIGRISNVSYDAKAEALLQLNTDMSELSRQFVDAYYAADSTAVYSPPASAFETAAQRANDRVANAVRTAIEGNSSYQDAQSSALTEAASDAIRQGGWITLGSWHSTYAEVQAALQSAAYNGQIIETPISDFGADGTSRNLTVARMLTAAGYTVSKPSEEFRTYSLGRWIVEESFDLVANDTAGTNMVNPITTAKSTGDLMMNMGIAMYAIHTVIESAGSVGKVGLQIASKAAGFAGPVGHIVKMMTEVLMDFLSIIPIIGALLIIIGGVLSLYIPMIPFMTWFAALISYFASVIEGLIAAQIWAFGHLSLEGEGMGNRTEKGYMYLLNMLLRPPLMVLGFFFASAILILLGTFLVGEIRTVIENVQGNSMTGLLSIIGFFVIFAILLLTMTSTVFDMVFEIPDRVIAHFGNGMEARMAKNMDSKIEGQVQSAARWTGGAGTVALQAKNARGQANRNAANQQQ